MPATYMIDTGGKIIKAFVETDYTQRLDPQEIIPPLEAIDGAKVSCFLAGNVIQLREVAVYMNACLGADGAIESRYDSTIALRMAESS